MVNTATGAAGGAAAGTAISPGLGTVIGGAIGALGGLASSVMSGKSAKKAAKQANEMAIWQQLENQKFQEYMSNTAHQREVADLKAAGLNPVLSANAGASMGNGGIGNVPQSASIDYTNAGKGASEGLEKMIALKSLANQIKNTDAEIERKAVQNANETATTEAIVQETQAKKDLAQLEAELLRPRIPTAKAQAEAEKEEADARKGEANILKENQRSSLWRFARGFSDITGLFLNPIGQMMNIANTGIKAGATMKNADKPRSNAIHYHYND